MRKSSFIIAAIAGLALCNAATANMIEFHFTQANTSEADFQHDNQICSKAATTQYVTAHAAGNGGSALRFQVVQTEYPRYVRADLFYNCMIGKGYRPDQNGFSTGKMWLPA